MKSKIIFTATSVAFVALMMGYLLTPTVSQAQNHIVPVGKTTQQTSQLILWYDEDELDENNGSWIQITNGSVDTPVWVHVQVFASTCTDFDDTTEGCLTSTVVLCAETNFNDFYTPQDTHVYEMDDVHRNDPLNQDPEVADFENTKGFVVVTPIDAPGTRNAIAHQHMFGNTYMFNFEEDWAKGASSMGRDAVSFSTGAVVADGTVLDGVANGYVLIQPSILKFNFNDDDFGDADLMSIAFSDNYEGVFGYVAEPADATWTPLIFDEDENPISCSTVAQNCFLNIGVNDELDTDNDLLAEDLTLCPGNTFEDGWMKIAVGGLSGLENEIALSTFSNGDEPELAVANWMFAE